MGKYDRDRHYRGKILQAVPAVITAALILICSAHEFITPVMAQAGGIAAAIDGAGYLSDVEKEVFRELNLARTDPRKYAAFLEATLPYYQGTLLSMPGKTPLRTTEGSGAVREAITFLKNQAPRTALIPSKGMSRSARDHAKDQGPKGTMGHQGSDGSMPRARLMRYGAISVYGENISYGGETAREIIMQLIIDDGVAGRGHRINMFRNNFKYAGVAVGPHAGLRVMCVIDFAGKFTEGVK